MAGEVGTDAIVAWIERDRAMQPAMDSLDRLDRMLQVAVDALFDIASGEPSPRARALAALGEMAGLREPADA